MPPLSHRLLVVANSDANARRVGVLLGLPAAQCARRVKPIVSPRDIAGIAEALRPLGPLPTIWLSDDLPDAATMLRISGACTAQGFYTARYRHHPWHGLQFTYPTFCVGSQYEMRQVAFLNWGMPRDVMERLSLIYLTRNLATPGGPKPGDTLWVLESGYQLRDFANIKAEAHNRGFLLRDFREHPHYAQEE